MKSSSKVMVSIILAYQCPNPELRVFSLGDMIRTKSQLLKQESTKAMASSRFDWKTSASQRLERNLSLSAPIEAQCTNESYIAVNQKASQTDWRPMALVEPSQRIILSAQLTPRNSQHPTLESNVSMKNHKDG